MIYRDVKDISHDISHGSRIYHTPSLVDISSNQSLFKRGGATKDYTEILHDQLSNKSLGFLYEV